MSAPHDLDRRLHDWLQDGRRVRPSARSRPPSTTPPPIRGGAIPWRSCDATRSARRVRHASPRWIPLVAALGLLLVAALAVATVGGLFPQQPAVVPPLPSTSPAPSVAPSASPAQTSAPSPVASPSPATTRVDLIDDIGGTAYVEITDRSGTLVRARSGQSSEAGPVTGDIGANNLAGDPASIVLSWVGCPSDTRHVLTIAADRRTMTLDQPVCQGDTLGVDRVLVLTFDRAVPASDVDVSIRHTGG